ncbi:MAG TPA: ABC transporter ATP-binding protein [Rhizobiaceae bacterium]
MAPEPLLRLQNLSKRFPGGVVGLDAVDMDIFPGEFVSLLGPSGCGKTTSLRVIAGFETPTEGRVMLDGRDITGLRPYDRPVNTVFQDYALFPHMDVAQNVGFGLTLRKIDAATRSKRVRDALDLVGLAEKISARVSELSGGQRQRVALARAIVCEPRILLLDEPLSALDAHLREQMQVELKSLQARLGTTFVMVTHDQTEALSISDRIVVMHKGRIEQVATPPELYDRPATRFVAGFIGTMNILQARPRGELPHMVAEGLPVLVSATDISSGPITVGIRPEDLEIEPQAQADTAPATISSIVFHGRMLRLHAILGNAQIVIDVPRRGDTVSFRPGDIAHIRQRAGSAGTILV